MTSRFTRLFAKLPDGIKDLAELSFKQFKKDPSANGLHHHKLEGTKSASVRVNRSYLALYYIEGQTRWWYWIGTHEDFNNLRIE